MHGLTIRPPWSFAVSHLGKRIENRRWPLPRWIIDKRLEWLRDHDLDVPLRSSLPMGAVVAVTRVLGWTDHLWSGSPQYLWFAGPYGWVLDEVVVLPRPVVCRGYQKLWRLPAEVEDEVREQMREAA